MTKAKKLLIPKKQPLRMLTIRQVADLGVLSEYALRKMEKCNQLPAIKIGNRTLINYNLLLKQLNNL